MRPTKLKARRCSFTLPPELRVAAEARAAVLGLDFSAYVAAVVRNDLIRPRADLIVRAERSVKNKGAKIVCESSCGATAMP